jgi:hypothetical protein
MLRIVLAVASGAIGGCWLQRTIAGSIPGSILALIGYSGFVYPSAGWHVAVHWRSLGFLMLGLPEGGAIPLIFLWICELDLHCLPDRWFAACFC